MSGEPPAPDFQAMIRNLIGANLAVPIHGFPDADASRLRLLDLAGIPVGPDGWVAGVEKPEHQGPTGCRFAHGTWIHYPSPEHTCPKWARG